MKKKSVSQFSPDEDKVADHAHFGLNFMGQDDELDRVESIIQWGENDNWNGYSVDDSVAGNLLDVCNELQPK